MATEGGGGSEAEEEEEGSSSWTRSFLHRKASSVPYVEACTRWIANADRSRPAPHCLAPFDTLSSLLFPPLPFDRQRGEGGERVERVEEVRAFDRVEVEDAALFPLPRVRCATCTRPDERTRPFFANPFAHAGFVFLCDACHSVAKAGGEGKGSRSS